MTPASVRGLALDAALGLGAAGWAVEQFGDRPRVVGCQLLMAAALVGRRRWPMPAVGLFGVAFVLQLFGTPVRPTDDLPLVSLPLLAYAAAAYLPAARAYAAGLLLLAPLGVEILDSGQEGDWGFVLGVLLLGFLPGLAVAGRHRQLADLAGTAERSTAAAVAAERARIARELHDVVSHSVGAMVVQATAADAVLDTSPELAREALTRIQATGRQAVTELHRLLGLLRDGDADATTAPQPGLAQLPELVEQARAAGTPVSLELTGDPAPLPPALQLSAYRIVQEGLTNAGKHAPGSPVRVAVAYTADELRVEVVDRGAAVPAAAARGGHGLTGMRERVALFGGRLDAGPAPGGGYAVRALLPVVDA